MNGAATIDDDITGAGNSGISELRSGMRPLSSKIAVNISIKMVIACRLQDQTTGPCKVKVTTKIFHSILVSPVWVVNISCTHVHCHQDVWMSVLCKKIYLTDKGPVVPGSIERSGIWIRWYNLACEGVFLCDLVASETNIFKDLINETRLCHCDCDGSIRFRCMCYLYAKKTFNITFILEKEFSGKKFAEVINDQVIMSEHQTIIGIHNQNAILVNEQTGINVGLDEAMR